MSIKSRTKEIVDNIKALEEEKYKMYDLSLNIETPTEIEYFAKNIKKGNFNFIKKSINEIRYNYILGKSSGFASSENTDICIFARNYDLKMILKGKKTFKSASWHEVMTTFITYHEIRHALQNELIGLNLYDAFCTHALSDYNGLQGYLDTNYHDSLYNEIDANLYAATESLKHFKGNKEVEEYFHLLYAKYTAQKTIFNFDDVFERLQSNIEKEKFDENSYLYAYDGILQIIWNQDGSFKRPYQIAMDPKFNDISKGNTEHDNQLRYLCMKIITSDAYLSKLDNNLDIFEEHFMNRELHYLGIDNEHKKGVIRELCHDNLLDEMSKEKIIFILEQRLNEKKKYLSNLNSKTK